MGWSRQLVLLHCALLLATGMCPASAIEEEIVVEGRRDATAGIVYQLDEAALKRIPGVQDDALRAIVTLPGVTTNQDFSSGFAIRGTRPIDNRFFLDFLPVGYLFHLTGLSVVDGGQVASVTMLPAAAPADYQGAVGGYIEAGTRSPEQRRNKFEISVLDSGLYLDRDIGESGALTFGARISYYDLILDDIIRNARDDDDGIELVQLPQYHDYRLSYAHQLEPNIALQVFVDGARDDVEVLFADDADQAVLDPVLAGPHRFATRYNRLGAVLTAPQWRVGFGRVEHVTDARFGDVGTLRTDDTSWVGRGEVEQRWGQHLLRGGFNLAFQQRDFDILVRDNGCTEFDVDCRFSDDDFVTTEGINTALAGSVFVADEVNFSEQVRMTFGLSYAFDNYLDESAVTPRLALDVSVSERLALNLAAGAFAQSPRFDYTVAGLGNPSLELLHAWHYALGINYLIGNGSVLVLGAYYKDLDNLVTSDPLTRYDNRGVGKVTGGEMMLKTVAERWSGWLSLAVSRSTREDQDVAESFDFAFDQTLVASLVAKYEFSERLAMSGRAAWHTGPPQTPILGGVPDGADPTRFEPIYGAINSERLPDYFRLDLRLDWTVSDSLLVFFELINGSNARNVAAYRYSADYASRDEVQQLPRFVSFGLEKTW